MMQNMLFLIVIFAWSLPTFVFKDLTKHIGNVELMIYYHLIYHVFIFGFIIYNIVYKKNNAIEFVNSIRNIPLSLKLISVGAVILSLAAQFSLFQLLRGYDVNTIIPIFRGGSTVVIVLVGYLLYKEKISFLKLVGIFTVLLGIYMVNKY